LSLLLNLDHYIALSTYCIILVCAMHISHMITDTFAKVKCFKTHLNYGLNDLFVR